MPSSLIAPEKTASKHALMDRCFLTHAPILSVERADLNEISYTIRFKGNIQRICLQAHDYENDGWFQYNRERILKKVETHNCWGYLRKGLSYDELQDFFVAPPKVLRQDA